MIIIITILSYTIIISVNLFALGILDSYTYCDYYWAGPGRPDPEHFRCVIIMIIIIIIVIRIYITYS